MPTSTRRAESRSSAPFWTPWGEGLVYVRDGLLVEVLLPPGRAVATNKTLASVGATVAPDLGSVPPGASLPAADEEALAYWVDALEAYFHGERLGWVEDEIPLEALVSSPFRRAVYRTLLRVPPGTTVSYGELAEAAGYPRAARAVGTAMAANPTPVVIPCHRVILADGRLGKYGEDPVWKDRLLRHEHAHVGSADLKRIAGGRHG